MVVFDCGPDAVNSLAFGWDCKLLAGTLGGSLVQSDGFSVSPVAGAELISRRPIHDVMYHPTNGTIFIAGPYGFILLKDLSGTTVLATNCPGRTVTRLGVPDPSILAVGFGDPSKPELGSLELFDLGTLEKKGPTFREKDGVRAVAGHPPKQTVAWSTGGKQVVVWAITKPDKWRVSLPNSAPSLAFHPEGRWLAAAQDWNVLPIDTERKQLRDPMKGHKGRVTAVAFHPHDGTLYSTSWDGTVRLWDVVTGTERQCFDWKLGRLLCLAVAPDGTRAAAGSESGKVVIWDVS